MLPWTEDRIVSSNPSSTYSASRGDCTTNVRVHIKNIASARPWDWQLLVNGTIEWFLK